MGHGRHERGALDDRLARTDTVIYLDLPTRACLSGIVRRRLRFRRQLRPDLGVWDRITWEFLRWVWSFRRRQRPILRGKLADFQGQTFLLRQRRDVRRLLDTIPPQQTATLAA